MAWVPLCTIDLWFYGTHDCFATGLCVCVSVTIAANVSSHEANRRTRVPDVSHQRFSPTRWSGHFVLSPYSLFPILFSFLFLFRFILVLGDLILPHAHHLTRLLLHHSTPIHLPTPAQFLGHLDITSLAAVSASSSSSPPHLTLN